MKVKHTLISLALFSAAAYACVDHGIVNEDVLLSVFSVPDIGDVVERLAENHPSWDADSAEFRVGVALRMGDTVVGAISIPIRKTCDTDWEELEAALEGQELPPAEPSGDDGGAPPGGGGSVGNPGGGFGGSPPWGGCVYGCVGVVTVG